MLISGMDQQAKAEALVELLNQLLTCVELDEEAIAFLGKLCRSVSKSKVSGAILQRIMAWISTQVNDKDPIKSAAYRSLCSAM